jgi:hypothetical protein
MNLITNDLWDKFTHYDSTASRHKQDIQSWLCLEMYLYWDVSDCTLLDRLILRSPTGHSIHSHQHR